MFYSPAVTRHRQPERTCSQRASEWSVEQRNVISIKKWHAFKFASDNVNIHCEQCWPKFISFGYTREDGRAGGGCTERRDAGHGGRMSLAQLYECRVQRKAQVKSRYRIRWFPCIVA